MKFMKWKTTQRCNRSYWSLTEDRLLRLVGTIFDSKMVSLRRMKKKILIILQIINKQINSITTYRIPDPPFFVCHLICQISIESVWKIVICLLNVLMTECCIESFTQYYNNLHFYCAIINWDFIWNIDRNNGVYCDLCNKSVCLNTVYLQCQKLQTKKITTNKTT